MNQEDFTAISMTDAERSAYNARMKHEPFLQVVGSIQDGIIRGCCCIRQYGDDDAYLNDEETIVLLVGALDAVVHDAYPHLLADFRAAIPILLDTVDIGVDLDGSE
jgi:hypothetical protein